MTNKYPITQRGHWRKIGEKKQLRVVWVNPSFVGAKNEPTGKNL
jgi:hypothetical protein